MAILIYLSIYCLSVLYTLLTLPGIKIVLLLGVPLIYITTKHLYKNIGRYSTVPAAMCLWVTLLASCNLAFEWPIQRFLFMLIILVTSFFVGIGMILKIRKYYHENPTIKMQIKKEPSSVSETMEQLDKKVQFKKSMFQRYGWIGLFIEQKDIEEPSSDEALFFNLGEPIELKKVKEK